jgi:hypothetical protein
MNACIFPQPIQSSSPPNVSQTQHNSDDNHVISPPRGVLSRLVSEREQRKLQNTLSSTSNKNSFNHTASIESDPLASYDKVEESNSHEFTAFENENENENNLTNTNTQVSVHDQLPSFGHEYFLDDWTLGRVKTLLENQISINDQLCLNIYNDQNNVQNLIDEQINGSLSLLPFVPPDEVRIELIKLYDHVETIFPSRAIHLYNNDYLLLAILCSNNQCAYIRTTKGWAYTDEESDDGQSIIIDEITQMIDDSNNDIQYESEQCRYVLNNACFLYYKHVE